METIIRNFTPHTVTVITDNGTVSFPSEGVARAKQANVPCGAGLINGMSVPFVQTTFGEPEGLPEKVNGVYLIVSIITANAAKASGRDCRDLLLTCDPVRDEQGRIVGCRSLAMYGV